MQPHSRKNEIEQLPVFFATGTADDGLCRRPHTVHVLRHLGVRFNRHSRDVPLPVLSLHLLFLGTEAASEAVPTLVPNPHLKFYMSIELHPCTILSSRAEISARSFSISLRISSQLLSGESLEFSGSLSSRAGISSSS